MEKRMTRNRTSSLPKRRFAAGLLAIVGSIIVSFSSAAVVRAAEGDLDSGFGNNGVVTTHIGLMNQFSQGLKDVAIAADGKIVVAGYHDYSNFANPGQRAFVVARYLPSGSPDLEFGAFGICVENFGSGNPGAEALAIQPDGKVILVGTTGGDFGVMRFDTQGCLDRTFSGDGKVTTDIAGGTDWPYAVAIQADGKIVVVGYSTSGSKHFAAVRYLPNGSLDTTFGTGGKVITRVGTVRSPEAYATDVTIQSDGKIVVVGTAKTDFNSAGTQSAFRFAVVRYNSNGELDPTFGNGGSVTTDVSEYSQPLSDEAWSVALQSDGKVVVAGTAAGGGVVGVTRYQTNGSLDTSFGTRGRVRLNPSDGTDWATDVAVQQDGKIVVAGTANYTFGSGETDNFAVVRLSTDGQGDRSFSNGLAETNIGRSIFAGQPGSDIAHGMAIQPDGDIVVVGSSFNSKDYDFALVRYRGDEVSPTVTIARAGTGSLGSGATDTVIFTLSEPSSTFDQSDVVVANGSLSGFTGSGMTYTANLTSTSTTNTTITIDVAAGRFSDARGNSNIAASQLSVAFDPTLPSTAGAGTVPATNNLPGSSGTSQATNDGTTTSKTGKDVEAPSQSRSTANGTSGSASNVKVGSVAVSTRAIPKLRVRKTVKLSEIASYARLDNPRNAKVTATVSRASKRYCSANLSRVKGLKVGRCRVQINVTTQDGYTTRKFVTLPVSR